MTEKTSFMSSATKCSHALAEAFNSHPRATGENYIQHLVFTVKMSARFLCCGVVLLTHGIFPFLFTRTASKQVAAINEVMKGRGKCTTEQPPVTLD